MIVLKAIKSSLSICSVRSFNSTSIRLDTSAKPRRIKYMSSKDDEIKNIRNIGIIAHIDAGKTTTTEKMLYRAGFTDSPGNVNSGNTVTDYLEEERKRGITIVSAAVTFFWNSYRINLIDTPGHIDFTIEVERCLRALDGAIVILDGSSGVEPQTTTVWKQADRYKVPRVVYINKMDSPTSNFEGTINSLHDHLGIVTLPLQIPFKQNNRFNGVVDLLSFNKLSWSDNGAKCSRSKLDTTDNIYDEALAWRATLIETLADFDDKIASFVLASENYKHDLSLIDPRHLGLAVKNACIKRNAFPVLCGSSALNMGLEPLLDGVVHYLPAPFHKASLESDNLVAYAFKVTNDQHHGFLVYLRIYKGHLKSKSKVFNVNKKVRETVKSLMIMYANEYEVISSSTSGNIVVAVGLNSVETGDFLTSGQANDELVDKSALEIPPPVFFCHIEAPSAGKEAELKRVVSVLTREDPSLHFGVNRDTNQMILSGMGELHLEVVKHRIETEFQLQIHMGPVQIAYKETLLNSCLNFSHSLDKCLGATYHSASVELSVEPCDGIFRVTFSDANQKHKNIITYSLIESSNSGPLAGFPLIGVHVTIHSLIAGKDTSQAMVSACVLQACSMACLKADISITQPIMTMQVAFPLEYYATVVHDLGRRKAHIIEVNQSPVAVVDCSIALAETLNYIVYLRKVCHGYGNVVTRFSHYEVLDRASKECLLAKLRMDS